MPSMPVMTIGEAELHRVEELRIPNEIAYFHPGRDTCGLEPTLAALKGPH